MIDNTFVVYTLIDVTKTETVTPKGTSSKYKQFQNYNSFLQALSLRTQIFSMKSSFTESQDLTKYNFGSNYKTGKVWRLIFQIESEDIWKKEDDFFYHAHHDLHLVPIYNQLSETATIENYIDCLTLDNRNTYLEKYVIV